MLHETDNFARQIVAAVGRMGSRAYEQGRLDANTAGESPEAVVAEWKKEVKGV